MTVVTYAQKAKSSNGNAARGASMTTTEAPKLKLLVDLDHTLIHTSKGESTETLCDDVFAICGYRVKVRPHAKQFLESMAERYEMTIVTLAHRLYAKEIMAKIDSELRFFDGRIIARDALTGESKIRNLKTWLPEGLSLTAIVDDNLDVWNYSENVIRAKPYVYFRNSEEDDDDVLVHLERVLIEVHREFYEHFEKTGKVRSLREFIIKQRREVLNGVKVAIPGGYDGCDKDTRKSKLIAGLLNFGAEIRRDVTAETTVVLTNKPEDEMVVEAGEKNIPVVTFRWVVEAFSKWKIPEFEKFLLEKEISVEKQSTKNPTLRQQRLL